MKSTTTDALKLVKSNDHVFIHSGVGAPQELINGLVERAEELQGVEIYHLHTEGKADYSLPEYASAFKVNALFIGANVRSAIQEGRGSYIPIFLSEVPKLFKHGIIKLDVALITVSPPDDHGYCSLGVAVDTTKAAVQNAKCVIAQVNNNMPRTHGDGLIHISNIDTTVEKDELLPEIIQKEPSELESGIGKNVASLIEDRSCIQMGIGAIPNAVLEALQDHTDLGVHTEMFSDGVIPLVEKGVITGKYKKKHPGKIASTFAMGSNQLYSFVNDNPGVVMLECDYVNDTHVIRQNPRTIAINSAIEIDVTGQVCADSIGKLMYSGVGGQMDFIRGASLSKNGKPIIALPSITKKGESRIETTLKKGAGVVSTRAHIHYVVTENGIANLYGRSLKDRAAALIEIAHPDHQERLEREASELYRGHFHLDHA